MAGLNRNGWQIKPEYPLELKSISPSSSILKIPEDKIGPSLNCNDQYYTWLTRSRGHIIDYFYDTEQKILNYDNNFRKVILFNKNFYIEDEEIEYFISYYKTGQPLPQDPFSKMMEYHINKNKISFCRNIDETWLIGFEQWSFNIKEPVIRYANN